MARRIDIQQPNPPNEEPASIIMNDDGSVLLFVESQWGDGGGYIDLRRLLDVIGQDKDLFRLLKEAYLSSRLRDNGDE